MTSKWICDDCGRWKSFTISVAENTAVIGLPALCHDQEECRRQMHEGALAAVRRLREGLNVALKTP